MQVGFKGRGDKNHQGKICVSHHGSRMRHGKGRPIEKGIETALRQAGKKACRERDS